MHSGTTVYLGLGGNIGNTLSVLNEALNSLSKLEGVDQLKASHFYLTSPVGNPNQNFFINAVCFFKTYLEPKELFRQTQSIERALGKRSKPKEAPRLIDIDILLYGSACYSDADLQIPHPRWKERLFVLVPLSEFASEIEVISNQGVERFVLQDLICHLYEKTSQTVDLLNRPLSKFEVLALR